MVTKSMKSYFSASQSGIEDARGHRAWGHEEKMDMKWGDQGKMSLCVMAVLQYPLI